MSRYEELEKLKQSMGKGKPEPKKPSKKKEEPKVELEQDMDVNDDGQLDEKDVEMVQKEVRKKKVVKQEIQ
jgi:hypothetical protein